MFGIIPLSLEERVSRCDTFISRSASGEGLLPSLGSLVSSYFLYSERVVPRKLLPSPLESV